MNSRQLSEQQEEEMFPQKNYQTWRICWILENIILYINRIFFSFVKDGKTEKADTSTSSGKASMKSVLENLGELWDQEQYDTEYSLENFMHSLK